LECLSDDDAEESFHEISFMNKLSSPFIVSLDTNFLDGESVFIVMEYCPNGDVSGLIKKCRAQRTLIPEWYVIDLFTQITMGLNVCHRAKVLHRDIKADNIYISKANVAKLGDFGVSRNLSSTIEMSRTMAGTPFDPRVNNYYF
jgi:NIMA (never in mitosis gene a)-related kinase